MSRRALRRVRDVGLVTTLAMAAALGVAAAVAESHAATPLPGSDVPVRFGLFGSALPNRAGPDGYGTKCVSPAACGGILIASALNAPDSATVPA